MEKESSSKLQRKELPHCCSENTHLIQDVIFELLNTLVQKITIRFVDKEMII